MSMTKDELITLRRERGKQKLNIGDRVKAYDQDGTALYDGKVFEITGKGKCDNKFVYRLDGLMSPFYAEDLELVKQPTDEIKVGDRVVAHVGENMDWIGTVQKIIPDTDGLYGENLLRIRVDEGCLLEHRVSRCTKINPDKEDKTGSTITIPVKADFSEDVGFALLDRALELQKKYTELEGEIKRLYELVNDAMNGLHPLRLSFDNGFLGSIACMVCNDFRPLTEEEKAQFLIDIKNMADNLKKQSND